MATLPQLTGDDIYLTDGGLETTLVFLEGLDLPDFAAFPLLGSVEGKAAIDRYYASYLDLAERTGAGFVLDTPTWRANRDWGMRLGYDDEALAEGTGAPWTTSRDWPTLDRHWWRCSTGWSVRAATATSWAI